MTLEMVICKNTSAFSLLIHTVIHLFSYSQKLLFDLTQ